MFVRVFRIMQLQILLLELGEACIWSSEVSAIKSTEWIRIIRQTFRSSIAVSNRKVSAIRGVRLWRFHCIFIVPPHILYCITWNLIMTSDSAQCRCKLNSFGDKLR